MSERGAPPRPLARTWRGTVARAFGRGAPYYEEQARVQKEAAVRLMERLRREVGSLPEGPALEVGCGTGFVSRELCRLLPERPLDLTDLSEEMVRFCASGLPPGHAHRVSTFAADGEYWRGERLYALIVAAFVAQWFDDPAGGLRRLAEGLLPGGLLAVSLPVDGSFPEWRRASEEAGVPFSGEPLPEPDGIVGELCSGGLTMEWSVESLVETFPSPFHFFRHLTRMGAGSRSGEATRPGSLRRILRAWEPSEDGRIHVSYRVLFLTARKLER